MRLLDLLTILCTVSMVGTEFTISAFLNPALSTLDESIRLRTMPVLSRKMGRAMPFWYALGLILIGAEAFLRRNEHPSRVLVYSALLLWAIGIVYSVTTLVPINNRIAAADPGRPTSTVFIEQKRWDTLHLWRVVLLVVAVLCLVSGILYR